VVLFASRTKISVAIATRQAHRRCCARVLEVRGPCQPVPPVALVLASIASVQLGAAFAKSLFNEVDPPAVLLLRIGFAVAILGGLWRPRVAGRSLRDLRLVVAFGINMACASLLFYETLDRVPLGIVVTLAFVGPLGVAVAGSRRRVDLVWVALAAVGVALLAKGGSDEVEPLGLALGLGTGMFWAAHILLAVRTGRVFSGPTGLTLAMAVSLVVVGPVAGATAEGDILEPRVLGLGAIVAVLSTALPWPLELEALRRMPARVFGILMSLGPAAAALAGLAVLGERLSPRAVLAIALVIAASAGALRSAESAAPAEP